MTVVVVASDCCCPRSSTSAPPPGASALSWARSADHALLRPCPSALGTHRRQLAQAVHPRDLAARPADSRARDGLRGALAAAAAHHRRRRQLSCGRALPSPGPSAASTRIIGKISATTLAGPSGPDRSYPAAEEPAGNVHDSKQAVAFLRDLINSVHERLARRLPLEFRMDAAFFQEPVFRLLEAQRCVYASRSAPGSWLRSSSWPPTTSAGGRLRPASPTSNTPQHSTVDLTVCVMIYRKHLRHQTTKNFQLDLFTPDDGHLE
jgi:hypothetical protein